MKKWIDLADDTTLYTNMETYSVETLDLDINNNLWMNKLSLNATETKHRLWKRKQIQTPKIHEKNSWKIVKWYG